MDDRGRALWDVDENPNLILPGKRTYLVMIGEIPLMCARAYRSMSRSARAVDRVEARPGAIARRLFASRASVVVRKGSAHETYIRL